MVFYYTTVDPLYVVYVGRDKYENEQLLKYGWEEDVWLHVDKLSSAHVYVRLKEGQTLDDIPKDVLTDCAQLVKYNSIEGNKQSDVVVVYTMWSNLRKTGDMDVGQVGFHSYKAVKKITVERRDNEIMNRLNRSKREEFPDLAAQKAEHERLKDRRKREQQRQRRTEEKEVQERYAREKAERSYTGMFDDDYKMTSNQDMNMDSRQYEEDFM